MKYRKNKPSDPQAPRKIGVLVTNLGTPDAPERGALRRYLKEFLSDPRVVEFPRLLWWFVLNCIILNIRPARSAKAYKTVWTERGSPLLFHSQDQTDALRTRLRQQHGEELEVEFAMRYGNPAISDVMEKMLESGVNQLLVMPLYPQYCAATTGSTFDAVAEHLRSRRELPALRYIADYHDNEDYIGALALKIKAFQAEHGKPDKLMFSYHGVPRKYCDRGDPYFLQCHNTTRLVVELLDLAEDDYMLCFQSRFGREEWLTPYADETLKALPGQGVKSVQVICPGFSADCLETIEEIGEENREYFLEAGGEEYAFIPCLNSDDEHIAALAKLAENELAGWINERLD